jgi:hypothetical protein
MKADGKRRPPAKKTASDEQTGYKDSTNFWVIAAMGKARPVPREPEALWYR